MATTLSEAFRQTFENERASFFIKSSSAGFAISVAGGALTGSWEAFGPIAAATGLLATTTTAAGVWHYLSEGN